MSSKTLTLGIVAILIAGGAYFWLTQEDAIGDNDPSQDTEEMSDDMDNSAMDDSDMNMDGDMSMEAHIDMMDDGETIMAMAGAFHPAVLYVEPEQELRIANHENTDMQIVFESGTETEIVAAGDEGTFTAPSEPGTYEYYSSTDQNIRGTLVVEL